ncbi:Hypothetical protein SRAE_2000191800 [Strongyloides ratti]|uniref:Uncharacterized protein n=1 Tax=Strongyloides ratti TaxID=34506 RepID=A0A090MYI7_STRRB|nr:Hypothetical protein SRAE_2000191800 [Strongyloides ratti]CEF67254.1 Hypothetical protein SRAE_2000191800 [Strongyloides ratti]
MIPTNKPGPSLRFVPPIGQTLGLTKFENKLINVFNKTLKTCGNKVENLNHGNYETEESSCDRKYPTINKVNGRRKMEIYENENCLQYSDSRVARKNDTIYGKKTYNHINENRFTSVKYSSGHNKKSFNAFAKNQILEVLEAASIALENKF